LIPLSRWPAAETDETRPVAFGREGERSAVDLRRDVASLVARASEATGGALLLHCDGPNALAGGLLAPARLGARALLPPSRQPGAQAPLAVEAGGAILGGDASAAPRGLPCWNPLESVAASTAPALDASPFARDAELAVLFTSGTTGGGSRVAKAVRHLEDEVDVLEARFGSRLGAGTPMLATVAPQHLYGLLFRVLWPLASGRPFLRSAVLHPEELAPHARAAEAFALATAPATLRHLVARGELALRREACRAVFSSGGPLPEDVARGALDATGDAPF
jgi:acyl-coenzyme A synthetase/AMP-(fatty) acid ligase